MADTNNAYFVLEDKNLAVLPNHVESALRGALHSPNVEARWLYYGVLPYPAINDDWPHLLDAEPKNEGATEAEEQERTKKWYLSQLEKLLDAKAVISFGLSTAPASQITADGNDSRAVSDEENKNGDTSVLVLPRHGTVTPWSSKATDIAIVCGFPMGTVIERACLFDNLPAQSDPRRKFVESLICDPMLETLSTDLLPSLNLLAHRLHDSVKSAHEMGVNYIKRDKIAEYNKEAGLALAQCEVAYLTEVFSSQLNRDPTDVELMMFSQVNSEHCRHKIFNSRWLINNNEKSMTLFEMIKNTFKISNKDVISAYSDNAAVVKCCNPSNQVFTKTLADGTRTYEFVNELSHLVLKAETHNHPTAVSPYPGAATGAGGEIRDEGSVGQGAHSKFGVVGYIVSDLEENTVTSQSEKTLASALEIMMLAPLGAANYGNEFGRPLLTGFFRTLKIDMSDDFCYSFVKPVMLAGGVGCVRPEHCLKKKYQQDSSLVVLGGPAMKIGLGGGAASSGSLTANKLSQRDFGSVQRDNPEMQRRCQNVIDYCCSLSENTPILSIHDVGAGGLSNAMPELVHDADFGGVFDLSKVPVADNSMSALQIWCNESQERYVLAIENAKLRDFDRICKRERCPYAVIGVATSEKKLRVEGKLKKMAVDMDMDALFGTPNSVISKQSLPKRHDNINSKNANLPSTSSPIKVDEGSSLLRECVKMVISSPSVASKEFLVTIADRTVGGLTTRDQMCGPWQVCVSDVGVVSSAFESWEGECASMGERPALSVFNPKAMSRITVSEAITNLAAAKIKDLSSVCLSANWMASAGTPGEGAALYDAVESVGMELCPALKICVPVGKDSLSMRVTSTDKNITKTFAAPVCLVITAAGTTSDTRQTWTPCLQETQEKSCLVLVDLGAGKNRMACSALALELKDPSYGAMKTNELGSSVPDLDSPELLQKFWDFVQSDYAREIVLAYHDRSDGGLFATVMEMCFAGCLSANLFVNGNTADGKLCDRKIIEYLFSEELGAVFQVLESNVPEFLKTATHYGLDDELIKVIGTVEQKVPETEPEVRKQQIKLILQDKNDLEYASFSLDWLWEHWNTVTRDIESKRDHKETAEAKAKTPRATYKLFSNAPCFDARAVLSELNFLDLENELKPRVAILREQGVNSHMELAYAFMAAGFNAIDLHMSELVDNGGKIEAYGLLESCVGIALGGGFSYGDVLGAGRGWAFSILGSPNAKEAFRKFFARQDTFALGICNGCQALAHLEELVEKQNYELPWPRFVRNRSRRFEARTVNVVVRDSDSIFFRGMQETELPVPVANGEGRANLSLYGAQLRINARQVPITYKKMEYPANPSGAPLGLAGVTALKGRITMLMPHPERAARWIGNSWIAPQWRHPGFSGPWQQIFVNARKWVAEVASQNSNEGN